ncbi:MAG: TRAP transporter small permease [Sulfolobales archaeon]|nr:TRAP transporter small permease [Sulfolobales archaeon]MCX8186063.1 TRAP transporter small permease [Sulfolobales archaeon]MDW7969358.1 TRAP transporter small permease [Sulfolobales archaeon]
MIVFLSILTLLDILAVVVYVLSRYFFKEPLMPAFAVSTWFFGLLFLLGYGYTAEMKGHISVDLLYKRLKPRLKYVITVINIVIVIASLSLLVPNTYALAMRSYLIGERDSTIPLFSPYIWWYKWILLISIVLAILYNGEQLIRLLRRRKLDEN